MKKYNLIILFVLILITISVSSYFFYLDIIYKDKLVQEDVRSLYELKQTAGKPIVVYMKENELDAKVDEYNTIIRELNLDAIAQNEKGIVTIRGAMHNGYAYVLLKRLLEIIKNDDVTLLSSCIGQTCTQDPYGFLIKFRPYTLQFR